MIDINTQEKSLQELLDQAVSEINVPEFIDDDPVQFPHRFSRREDIEIVTFLCAIMAWGRRPMILRDCERLLQLMDNEPLKYTMSGDYELLPDSLNIHRTMFASHLKYLLRGFRAVINRYGTIESFAHAHVPQDAAAAPWLFGEALRCYMADVNGGARCSECIPAMMDKTALKRINMALRWLVRDDGIVDLGIWTALKPNQLYIPLDVHVGNTSRSLGLLTRKSNDRKAAELLTTALRKFDPKDPIRYDFALFGLGIRQQA